MKLKIILIILLLIVTVPGYGQQRLEVEDFTASAVFQTESPGNINWMNDGEYYSALANNNIIKYSITTGEQVDVLFDSKSLDFSERINGYSFSANEQKILLMSNRESIYRRSYTAAYFVFDTNSKKLAPLSANGRQSYATFSPDGSKVGFVRENNLYYVDLESGDEVQITSDGEAGKIINGSTDWVYEEELSLTKAFYWSPEGDKLAYYRFDESHVKLYNLQKWLTDPLYPTFNSFKYPKAGEDNAKVNLFIHEVASGKRIEIDLGEDKDIYIPRVKWTKSNQTLSVILLNRLQNNLEIFHADAITGEKSLVLSLKYDTYVDIDQADDLTYLEDGKHFLITSEESGYKHLNLYSMDGKLVRQITSGPWEVSQLIGIDQKPRTPVIYYLSTEKSPMERQVYSINSNGKNKKLLTPSPGIHRVDMSNDYKYYLHYYHGTNHPLEVKLEKVGEQKEIKTITSNPQLKEAWATYDIVPKEFVELKASDGEKMYSYMLKPSDFDETKQYPVLIFQYSGPGSQNVNMGMGSGQNFYWHQLLVQNGYIVMVIDPRGTGARGAAFQKQTYKQLGKMESDDMIFAAKQLGGLDYIDENRIGIWGWSYGGYISSLSMFKGEGVFKMAIAVAPVTNWRYYDTIYTERYLQRPSDNPGGYDDNSPIQHAHKLQGKFLLIHGTGDDNVHVQNSILLEEALISSGKQFNVFYYPDRAHGIFRGNGTRTHLFKMMTNYVLENL